MTNETSSAPSPHDYIERAPLPRRSLKQQLIELDEDAFWRFVDSGEPTDHVLLQDYFHDLAHVPSIDEEAFRSILPAALEMWCDALHSENIEARYASAEMHAALYLRGNTLRAMLGASITACVRTFFLDTLRWSIDTAHAPQSTNLNWTPHWVGITGGFHELAQEWFGHMEAANSVRMGESYVAYLSRIAYAQHENPLFAPDYEGPEPWTREVYLTPGVRWSSESLSKGQEHLSAPKLVRGLEAALQRVPAESVFSLTAMDMLTRVEQLVVRSQEVLANLATPEPPTYWSDAFQR